MKIGDTALSVTSFAIPIWIERSPLRRGEAVTEGAPLRPDHGCKEADAGEGPFILCSAPQKPIFPSI